MIMLLSFWLFEKSFTTIVTITFTSLIVIEILNVFTTLTKWSKIVCISQLTTLVLYVISIILLRRTIDVSVIDLDFVKNVAIIVVLSWGPMQLGKWARIRFDPTESEKIMKSLDVEPSEPKPASMPLDT